MKKILIYVLMGCFMLAVGSLAILALVHYAGLPIWVSWLLNAWIGWLVGSWIARRTY